MRSHYAQQQNQNALTYSISIWDSFGLRCKKAFVSVHKAMFGIFE